MSMFKFRECTRSLVWGLRRLIFLLHLMAGCASAHPVAQGAMEIVVHLDRVDVRARVSVEQAFVAEGFSKAAPAESTAAIWPRHGDYLLKHLFIDVDGTKLAGRVTKITPSTCGPITSASVTAPTGGVSNTLRSYFVRSVLTKSAKRWLCKSSDGFGGISPDGHVKSERLGMSVSITASSSVASLIKTLAIPTAGLISNAFATRGRRRSVSTSKTFLPL